MTRRFLSTLALFLTLALPAAESLAQRGAPRPWDSRRSCGIRQEDRDPPRDGSRHQRRRRPEAMNSRR